MNPARLLSRIITVAALTAGPGLLWAGGEPVYDSRGIPYEAIDAEPSLGTIKAYNPDYNFLVAQLKRDHHLGRGSYVALRRDGVIVCFARVEELESSRVATLHLLLETTGIHDITQPSLGDEIIRIPMYGRGDESPPNP